MPRECAECEHEAVPQAEAVPGTPRVLPRHDVRPLVGAKSADDDEQDADEEESDQDGEPLLGSERLHEEAESWNRSFGFSRQQSDTFV